jgi:hypothetical protein
MVGFPKDLRTKQDYLNAVDYVKSTGSDKTVMISRLEGLKSNITMMVLKNESAGKPAEDQTGDDYHVVPDPNCEMLRLGFTGAEIDALIGGLN